MANVRINSSLFKFVNSLRHDNLFLSSRDIIASDRFRNVYAIMLTLVFVRTSRFKKDIRNTGALLFSLLRTVST